MGKTIYVVTRGSYSDYHIVAVFDDKVLAEAFVTRHNEDHPGWWEDADIEEWECNPNEAVMREGMMNYSVRVWAASEEATDVSPTTVSITQPTEMEFSRGRFFDMVVSAKDAQHAAKIGTEKRAIWLTYGIESIGGVTHPSPARDAAATAAGK